LAHPLIDNVERNITGVRKAARFFITAF